MTTKLIRVLAVTAIMGAVGAPAMAQPAPPPAAADRAGPDRPRFDPAERAQQRAERLRDVLQLRPNQEPALAELTKALAPPADMRERMQAARAEMRDLPTPARLDKQREHMLRRQQEFDRRAMAIKKFYAQLTPEQQKAFDALGPMGHGGGKFGGRGGHRGGMGGGGWGGHGGPGDRG